MFDGSIQLVNPQLVSSEKQMFLLQQENKEFVENKWKNTQEADYFKTKLQMEESTKFKHNKYIKVKY